MSTIVQVSVVDHQQTVGIRGGLVIRDHPRDPSLPRHLDLDDSDNALMSVYYFIKNFIGAPSGTSTVAIDNKIEQAMDLVKSHLMFAVREEVDVLKEKITELVDRISQLELENGILRANASQETLSQLPSTVPGIQGIAQPQVVQSAPTITPAVHHMRPTQQTISAQVQTATGQSPQQTSS